MDLSDGTGEKTVTSVWVLDMIWRALCFIDQEANHLAQGFLLRKPGRQGFTEHLQLPVCTRPAL